MKTLNLKLVSTIIVCAFISLISNPIYSQTSISQSKIEAIVQLAKFVDWSQNTTFSEQKRTLYVFTDQSDKTQGNRSAFEYKNWHIKYCNNLKELTDGAVIFINSNQKENIKKIIELSKKVDILTIADNTDNFCKEGGMINMIGDSNNIKFEINYRIIQNKSLEISSKVLALAKIYD